MSKMLRVGALLVNIDQILYIAPIVERNFWTGEYSYRVEVIMVGSEPIKISCKDQQEVDNYMNIFNFQIGKANGRENSGSDVS